MSVITDLGKIILFPVGDWNSSSTYNFLDIVSNNGNSYVAKQNVPTGTLLTNETYWQLLSSGTAGPAGNGIQNIAKISTSGVIDTYRITFTNNNYFDYNISNGNINDLALNFELDNNGYLSIEYGEI